MTKVYDTATDIIAFARGSSATYTGSDGTQQTAASDEPRIEYAADGTLKGLLIEEQRTNLLLNSDNPDTQVASLAAGSHTLSFVGGPSVTGISDSIDDNAVDVFVYDTSKDSDGGAWRTGSLAQASSWYAEASSPTRDPETRSTRAEFPAVAVIVAESNKVTIYDGDDPSLPTWWTTRDTSTTSDLGILRFLTAYNVQAISMLNGRLAVGLNYKAAGDFQPNEGVHVLDFAADRAYKATNDAAKCGYVSPLTSYPDTDITVSTQYAGAIVNGNINDVAMTVLPDAPTDPATGLPVPTIAVATDGGVSVIKDDGTVVDSAYTTVASYLSFVPEGLWYGRDTNMHFAVYSDIDAGDGFGDLRLSTGVATGTRIVSPIRIRTAFTAANNDLASSGDLEPFGFAKTAVDYTTFGGSMSSLTTSSYTTGWMNGDIKLAALANSATADRSVNNNPLTQNGTITAAPVATGADVVAYSGFSSSNYLEQPYNPDLDFADGDFCVMGWVKATIATQSIFDRGAGPSGLALELFSDGFLVKTGTTYVVPNIDFNIANGMWRHVAAVRRNGVLSLVLDGVEKYSAVNDRDVSSPNAVSRIGVRVDGSRPAENIALLRISATAPTADQIAKIYNDERPLFQPNAKATLTGNSDAVTALAHDPDTNLLHVGTSGGRSVFYGLRRVNETATAVTTAISAVDGLIVEQ